jgi:anti-sigma regulatory factor (Ser/Thr protein kinase)
MTVVTSNVVDLTLVPNVELISSIRLFVTRFYQPSLSADAVSRVALATHELLENAMRYGNLPPTEVRLRIEIMADSTVVLQTWNQTDESHRQTVEGLFDEMNSAPDPLLHYCLLMKRNAKRAGSGLGLARIRAEGEMDLSYELVNSEIRIEARTPVELRS